MNEEFLIPSIIGFIHDDETILTGSLGKKIPGDRGFEYIGGASLLHFDQNFTSINEIQDEPEIAIYPNPASEYITLNIPPLEKRGSGGVLGCHSEQREESEALRLSFLRMQESAIKIYDVFGNEVASVETSLRPVSTRIDITILPTGIYFVKVGGKVCKFVKI